MLVDDLTPHTLCDLCRTTIAEATLDGEPRCLGCAELEVERIIAVELDPTIAHSLPSLVELIRGR